MHESFDMGVTSKLSADKPTTFAGVKLTLDGACVHVGPHEYIALRIKKRLTIRVTPTLTSVKNADGALCWVAMQS